MHEMEYVAKILSKATGLKKSGVLSLLETPPDHNLGDIAFPCFSLSKILKKSPVVIAAELSDSIKLSKSSLISRIVPMGPYLNFFFDNTRLSKSVLCKIFKEAENYGSKPSRNEVIVVEYPSPNTNKPLHLGHLRNMSLGQSVSRILCFEGFDVKQVNLNNDRGIHICKSMLAYKLWGKNKLPDKKPDHFVGDFYVLYSKYEKENPSIKDEAQKMLRDWEAGDKATHSLWRKMNSWALKGFEKTYKRFGLDFDKVYFESDIYDKGKEIVLEGLEKGVFHKEEGAVVVNLGGGLGKKVLLRRDGTAVYITQDIYLAKLKYKDFRYSKSVYVVGCEQDYHFKVLFRILELLGFKQAKGCYHLSYGMVNLPSGKMKSREGTVVDADDLMDNLHALALSEFEKRKTVKKGGDKLAEKIGLAALKYYLLKFSPRREFVFDLEKSISFTGETGPYLQYSLVRAKKICQKAKLSLDCEVDFSFLDSPESVSLVRKLSVFPDVLSDAAKSYSPHLVCEYAFNICSLFNSFYETQSVINAESFGVKKARLLLVWCYSIVLESCLYLLGIEPVSIM